jgi:hypothetical protein
MLRQCWRTWFRAAVLVAILAGMPVLAQAELVTFAFEGTLSQIDAPLNSTWSPGQAFSGTYTFDSNTPNASAPGEGDYLRAPRDFHLTIGAAEMTAPPPFVWNQSNSGLGTILIQNAEVDSYGVFIGQGSGPAIPISGYSLLNFILDLTDSTGSALLSNELTTVPPALSGFQKRTATFNFYHPVEGHSIFASASGQVTGLTVVPLPAAAVLFGSGLLSLAGYCGVRIRKGTMSTRSLVEL